MIASYRTRLIAIGIVAGLFVSDGSAQPTLDAAAASAVFEEARDVVSADGGRLWGRSLAGPILLVNSVDRTVFASIPAPGFTPESGTYRGFWPDSMGIANTSVRYADSTWTMLMWPLPADFVARKALIGHELWHRVQGDLGFPSRSGETTHLGSRDGRYWLRLEWRALGSALASSGAARDRAIRDALLFRSARLGTFPDAADTERGLMMHEGLAEYTGWAVAEPGTPTTRTYVIRRLAEAESLDTFVRMFAYYSGPAWGMILDDVDPAWRSSITPDIDLGQAVATQMGWNPPRDAMHAARGRAVAYGGDELASEEDRLETERRRRRIDQRRRYVDDPILELPFGQMRVSFEPGTVDVLDDVGRVYGRMTVFDRWGRLVVDGGGLIRSGWSGAVVPAPSEPEARPVVGDGYELYLADGWILLPGERDGDWLVGLDSH